MPAAALAASSLRDRRRERVRNCRGSRPLVDELDQVADHPPVVYFQDPDCLEARMAVVPD